MIRPVAAFLSVAVLVGGGTAFATITGPDRVGGPAPNTSATTPVKSASFVCPNVTGQGPDGGSRLDVATVSVPDLDAPAGNAEVTPVTIGRLPAGSKATPLLTAADTAKYVGGTDDAGPWQVDVSGPLAPGTAADQLTRLTGGANRGLSGVSCTAPTTEAWFAGFATGVGQHARLLLNNIDEVPATAVVQLWGPDGAIEVRGASGVSVEPHAQTALQLDTLAPGIDIGALRVTTESGRVSAALSYDAQNGALPLGADWIPVTQAPARSLVVPGALPGDGPRKLVLAAPGDVDAEVIVSVIRPDGTIVPGTGSDPTASGDGSATDPGAEADPGADPGASADDEGGGPTAVTVPAGTVTTVDYADLLQGKPGAISLTSTEPVVAGLVQTMPGGGGTSDVAFSAAVPPLSGPALVPGNRVSRTTANTLLVTAPDADATVAVTVLPQGDVKPTTHQVQVPGGTTVVVDIAELAPADGHPAVAVVPGDGSVVYAARAMVEAVPVGSWTAATSTPLVSNVTSLTVRSAHADLQVGLPQGR